MKKINSIFSSVKLGVFLILLYALAVAIATFVENDYGTNSANWLVYKSTWFTMLNFILVINMLGVFIKYKMYQIKKLTIFAFHAGFVIIIIGAGVTRFMSYEGIMQIREGKTSNTISSYETYLQVKIFNDELQYDVAIPVNFNEYSGASLNEEIAFGDHKININIDEFIPNAAETIIHSENGKTILAFAVADKMGRENVYLKEGETKIFKNQIFNFTDKINHSAINIVKTDSGLTIFNPNPMFTQNMSDTLSQSFQIMEAASFNAFKLYQWGDYSMVLSKIHNKSITSIQPQRDKNSFPLNALIVNINDGKDERKINVFGKGSYIGSAVNFDLNNYSYSISYGSKIRELPFSLSLNEFKMKRYPGSMSPASYESYLTLEDKRFNLKENHQIYMNNVLSYDGFRFYQSSYDKDEKGTVLSVNKDYWGTMITYFGYFLLTLGMFLNIFSKHSRFMKLNKKLKELSAKSTISIAIIAFLGLSSLQVQAQTKKVDAQHAAQFGQILVQDRGGRIKPINTLANETLLKLSRKSTYNNLNAEQVFLGMTVFPQEWAKEKIIKIKNPDLLKRLNVKDNHVSLSNLFDNNSKYILQKDVADAYAKAPGKQNKYDKSIIKFDEKINILYMILNGDLLNIFPLRNDPNEKWYNLNEGRNVFKGEDSTFIYNVYQLYLSNVASSVQENNWTQADSSLKYIKMYQEKAGADIIISENKRDAEIFYNKSAIFRHLFEFYFIVGLAFLALLFVQLLFDKFKLKYLIFAFVSIIVIAFAFQSFALGLRWYISGHAPWSNGYESMIYISWATMLSGLIFAKKSKIALAATSLLSGIILLVAHLSWIDPTITNLVPVLQSYWLTIHVAVITASYGFLALGALLGFINLLLMILKKKSNQIRLDDKITQLTYINEMTLIAGLFLLSIGTFLGGIWANESWGRYWGWDAKETWALITMLVYAFILHMRFIPSLKSLFTFNFASLISYSTVMMTYFGVNYYLSGLHSYAKGDPVPIPMFVYYTLAVIFTVAIIAWIRNKRWNKQ